MARRSIRTGAPMNLATNLEASACFFPDNPAVRQGNLVSTHAQLNERANRIPTGLMKMGVASGEHVGLCALNSADWIVFYFGVLKAGAVAVTLPGTLTKKVPKEFFMIEEMPKNPAGKILKRELKKRLVGGDR